MFWKRVLSLYRDNVAHAFILYGNVRDYVPIDDSRYANDVSEYIRLWALTQKFDIIGVINPARGLEYPIPHQRVMVEQYLAGETPQATGRMAPPAPPIGGVKKLKPTGRDILPIVTPGLDDLLRDTLIEDGGVLRQMRNGDDPERQARMCLILEFGDALLADGEMRTTDTATLVRFIEWAGSNNIALAGHMLFILTESLQGIHSELRRSSARWEQIPVLAPDLDERLRFVQSQVARYENLVLEDGLTEWAVATMTAILTRKQIEDIFFHAIGEMGNGTLSRDLIIARKKDIVRAEFNQAIEVIDPSITLENIGGYSYLTDYLSDWIVEPWREGELTVGGILLPGPPGTGKTMLAEALAGSARVIFVKFAASRIFGGIVGETERNLERIFRALQSIAPCIFFIDEIDQQVQRGGMGDSGVSNRVFARLLEFMEDPNRRGKILVIAATNNPEMLDRALRSRFGLSAPLLPPDHGDRMLIFREWFQRFKIEAGETLTELADRTDGWVGRNIRDIVTDKIAPYTRRGFPLHEAISKAFEEYAPVLQEVDDYILTALSEVRDLSLVPPSHREAVRALRQRQTRRDGEAPEQRKREWRQRSV
jgi:SpoVK/Ycf46/Vps4 family AAA+-type ATPase